MHAKQTPLSNQIGRSCSTRGAKPVKQVSADADEPCDALRQGLRIVNKGGRSMR